MIAAPTATRTRVLRALALLAGLLVAMPPATSVAQISSDLLLVGGRSSSGASAQATTSADGSTVVFESSAQLTPSADGEQHLFASDVASGELEQLDVLPSGLSDRSVPVDSGRAPQPDVSADGRWVVFRHLSDRLDPDRTPTGASPSHSLYLRDRQAGTTARISIRDDGGDVGDIRHMAISDDGRTAAYVTDAPNVIDDAVPIACNGPGRAFVIDVRTLDSTQITLAQDGACPNDLHAFGDIDLSADGRYVTFAARGGDLVDDAVPSGILQVYRHDTGTGTTVLVSRGTGGGGGNADSLHPQISADGRRIAYQTSATDLVAGDGNARTDVVVTDVAAGTTQLVSRGEDGRPGPEDSTRPAISGSGRFVSFHSEARLAGPPLGDPPQGARVGVYRADLSDGSLLRVDVPPSGAAPDDAADVPTGVADDGSVAFTTTATTFPGAGAGGGPGGTYLARDGVDPGPPPPPATGGTDRITAFAIEISTVRFGPEGTAGEPARWAVISRDDAFADSLSGAVLTGGGPLLFTSTATLDPRTAAEVDRVLGGSGTVYLLGGVGAIGEGVAQALTAGGYTVQRLAGASRFETSVRIAEEARAVFGDTGAVGLARAFGPEGNPTAAWADSVTGGGWASGTGTPIVLTGGEELHPAVAAFLGADAPQRTVLLGGTGALSAQVEGAVPGPLRIAGANRAATAAAIAAQLFQVPTEGNRSYAVIDAEAAQGWAYGLAGAGLAGDARLPILATGAAANPPETLAAVAGCGGDQVLLVAFGPLGPGLLEEIDAQDDRPC